MPIKVAVFNRKGGVGKTTLSIILTQIALMNGKKVLAVDQDEQANFYVSVRYFVIPVRPDHYATMPFALIREAAGDGKYTFQFLSAKVGFTGNLASRLANEIVENFRSRGYPVVADLPTYTTIPANISCDRKKLWCTGLKASARRHYEHLYSQLEAYYRKLQEEIRKDSYRQPQGDRRSSRP